MTPAQRLTVGALTAAAAAAMFAGTAHAGAAPADDSVNIDTSPAPIIIEVYPQGSSLLGPVTVDIGNVVVDAGDIAVILDNVALLAQLHGPIETN